MAQLGDKQYNYSFYGLPDRSRVWGTSGVGGYAALTYLNIWGDYFGPPISEFATDGIYWAHDGTESTNNGKPLDDSIALWHLPSNSSFATNGIFSHDIGNSLSAHFDVLTSSTNVPLIAGAIDSYSSQFGNFGRRLEVRYAYDTSFSCNGAYSAPIFDIVPYNFCLRGFVIPFNRTSGAIMSGINLSSVKSTIDNSNDDIDICIIRPTVYRAATTPRFSTRESIPSQGQHTTYQGTILFDTLSDHLIPENQSYLRSLIGSDRVHAPWYYQYAQMLYNGTGSNSFDAQMDIGFSRPLTVTQLKNGAYTIDGSNKITAQLFRCNTDIKSFDDVVYKWDYISFDVTNKIDLQNGFPLDSLSNSDSIRFYTKLSIIDDKGETRGEALTRAIKHELAFIGLYFTDNATLAANAELGDGDGVGVYLPLFAGGVTTGEYVTGLDILEQPHARAGSIADPTYNYDPDDTPGGEDTGDFRTRINSGAISAGTIYYAVSDTEFKNLVRYLNTTYNPDESELAADFKGVNPFDYLTSVKYYPFPLPYAVAQQINVGPLATGVTGYIMPYTYGNEAYSYFDFGSYTFTPRFKNFLDYSATQIQLFLPWCGVVNLDPTIWIAPPGYNPITLKIRYSFDYVTGSVTAFIFRDNGNGEFLIDTADGSAGVDVPLSLFATGSYQQQIAQAQIAYKQAATSRFATWAGVVGGLLGAGVSAAFGNPLGVVGGIGAAGGGLLKLKQAELQTDAVSYTLDHTQPQLGSVSAASPFNAAVMDQRPFILITRPRMQSTLPNTWQTTYERTVGYACTVPAALSDPRVRGFTIIQSARLEGIKKSIGSATYTPTEQELALIRQHMAAGIIL